MTRIRQWLVSLAVAAVLTLSLTSVASADPVDPGNGFSTKSPLRATSDPVDPGRVWQPALSYARRRASDILQRVPAAISSDRRQPLELDGKQFLFQHGYRFGKVTYITRLPLGKSVFVWTPGHLTAEEVEAVIRGDNPWMLE